MYARKVLKESFEYQNLTLTSLAWKVTERFVAWQMVAGLVRSDSQQLDGDQVLASEKYQYVQRQCSKLFVSKTHSFAQIWICRTSI